MSDEELKAGIVASLADAWIETGRLVARYCLRRSRPSRTRGLKRFLTSPPRTGRSVASLADAWIETGFCMSRHSAGVVASLADAWIETLKKY